MGDEMLELLKEKNDPDLPCFAAIDLPAGNLLITYTGVINKDFHSTIIGFLSSLESDRPNFRKDFYFIISSPGGDATHIMGAPVIMKQLGMKKIISYSQCSSAALAIMMECRRLGIQTYIDPLCHVILHRCSTTMAEQRSERMRKYIGHFVEDFENTFDAINGEILGKLSEEDRGDYKHGNDVYILGTDLIKWGIFKEFNENTFDKKPMPKK
jgi:ATP-dependent protease ClpP protease subunit